MLQNDMAINDCSFSVGDCLRECGFGFWCVILFHPLDTCQNTSKQETIELIFCCSLFVGSFYELTFIFQPVPFIKEATELMFLQLNWKRLSF